MENIKAEKAAGALKTAISPDLRVLIRDCENDPLLIWDTLKTSFIHQRTAPHFNAYHALLSMQKKDSEALKGLINKVDEQIRIIKSLSVKRRIWKGPLSDRAPRGLQVGK